MIHLLQQVCKSHQDLKPENLKEEIHTYLSESVEVFTLKENDHIVIAGSLPSYVYFVASGIIRGYIRTPEGDEITTWFYDANTIIGSLPYHKIKMECKVSLQATCSTMVYRIQIDKFNNLRDLDENFDKMLFLMEYKNSAKFEDYAYRILRLNTEKRFEAFVKSYPSILHKTQGKYIASFLNLHPNTLSKIKALRI